MKFLILCRLRRCYFYINIILQMSLLLYKMLMEVLYVFYKCAASLLDNLQLIHSWNQFLFVWAGDFNCLDSSTQVIFTIWLQLRCTSNPTHLDDVLICVFLTTSTHILCSVFLFLAAPYHDSYCSSFCVRHGKPS